MTAAGGAETLGGQMAGGDEGFILTDLHAESPGVRRVAHGYASSGTWRRLLVRGWLVGREVTYALPRDLVRALRPSQEALIRVEPGDDPQADATRLTLYVHYSPTGCVSEMVRIQLRQLAACGFAIVFVTMADSVPREDEAAVRALCALFVHRRNFGLDFGAWHDLVPEVRRRWSGLQELMLANDSVLGPLYPLPPMIAALRSGGEGLFGLTESLQGGAHLQSYMLLAKGKAAVADLLLFLDRAFLTHSKWLLIQFTEIRLARWMRARGHRAAALYGYKRVLTAALQDAQERQRLAASHHKLAGLLRLPQAEAQQMLDEWPLNPTHHLWHVLATRFHAPFLKTELVRKNPGRLPDVAEWPTVVPADAPCPVDVLRDHLAAMEAAAPHPA